MAHITVILPHSYDDQNDRIAKQITRKYVGNRVLLLSKCDCCAALHITIPNLPQQNVMPFGIQLQEDMLRQNIDARFDMADSHVNAYELISNQVGLLIAIINLIMVQSCRDSSLDDSETVLIKPDYTGNCEVG